ncbi:MAG: glutamate formimidoyltransferase [Pseudomonadota bacterium]
MKLVECVPNFSEGRDRKVIDAIAAALGSVDGVTVLDVDPGAATNRTVYTMVGPPDAVAEAAFRGISVGLDLIDMAKHKGEHPRQGACDVCPFVPVADVTMDECVELANRVGRRVGEELGVPVYLYENAATRPERRNLAQIREGEYEALREKLGTDEWTPDYGPNRFVPKAGAIQVGARDFLIAYNINLNTRNPKIAKSIAQEIREKGGVLREDGRKVRGPDGKTVQKPGLFQHCKATGWTIEEYRCAQVSMNLTNYHVTPPHAVFDAVCRLADERGVRVTGSELVGLIPRDAILQAGAHYLRKQGASTGVPEAEVVEAAIRSMGLQELTPFDPDRKIIEYVSRPPTPLMDLGARAFVDVLSSDAPAPGGGSVAALAGALSAGLSSMVAALTYGKKGHTHKDAVMDDLGARGQALKDWFSLAVDRDTDAFNRVMDAFSLPRGTAADKARRAAAILEANKGATRVPLEVLERSLEAAELAAAMVADGNPNSLSDAGVAGVCAMAAAKGAYYNVLINIDGLADEEFVDEMRTRADAALASVEAATDAIEDVVLERLKSNKGDR